MYPFSNNKVPQIKELGSNGAGVKGMAYALSQ